MATTTAGEASGSCVVPARRQRSPVSASSDRTRRTSKEGVESSAPETSAMSRAATTSRRPIPPMTTANASTGRLEPQQASDDRSLARAGVGVDLEYDLLRADAGPI